MSRKKRILWVGEATFLHTGYSVYGKEVLNRLYNTGKYDIAELACYGAVDAPQRNSIPWKYYGNLPHKDDKQGIEAYKNNVTYQFGEWRFNDALVDFQPDVVMDIRDWWMIEAIERSPLRQYFSWLIMPTVDSAPQKEQWMQTFLNADAVLAYTEFGQQTLQKQGGDKIKFCGLAPPGADPQTMKPFQNKQDQREKAGFTDDINIVGFIARNQARKLFPEIFASFSQFCKNYPDLAEKTYLYCHTSYPDNGWDLAYWLRHYNISNKVLFTYKCQKCHQVYPLFFQDARAVCLKCGYATARLPDAKNGVSNEVLAQIFNYFDVYAQYSIAEGFGMPQIEAAYCGIPVMAVNYSAMESVIKNIRGIPIDVERFFVDPGTGAFRALPDNQDFADKLAKFLQQPKSLQRKAGRITMMEARRHYNYDKTAKMWEEIVDQMPLKDWNSPSVPQIRQPTMKCPRNISNEQFVRWLLLYVLNRPDLINSYINLRLLRDLNYGEAIQNTGNVYFNEASYGNMINKWQKFSRKEAFDYIMKLVGLHNIFEKKRCGLEKEKPYFIKYAKKDNNQ